jgi:hypothetical protein
MVQPCADLVQLAKRATEMTTRITTRTTAKTLQALNQISPLSERQQEYYKYTTKSITAIPEPDERLKEWETCRWDIPVKSPQLITAPAPRSISSIAGIDHL